MAVSCRDLERAPEPTGHERAANATAEAVDALLENAGFRGAFIVALGKERFLAKGYGYADRAETRVATPTTAYWSASVAKNFTAAAVIRLAEQGALDIDAQLVDHLSGLPPSWSEMTIRHLLMHASGIQQNYAADGVMNRDAALAAISAQPLGFQPGEGWRYSNDAYSVLAILIEVVSENEYEDYLQEALFVPAGMTDTGFRARPPSDLAEFEDPSYDEIAPSWGFRGGHGIATSAVDLHRWWLALISNSVLTEESRETMLSPQARVRDELSAGFGWFVERTPGGKTAVWARGTDQSGENAILYAVPEYGLAVIGVSHHEGDRDPVTRRVAEQAVALFEEAMAADS